MTDVAEHRHRFAIAALGLGVAVLLWLLAPVLTPFAISALLAYLGDPLVDRLERRGLSRTLAVVVVFAGMTAVLVGAILLLVPTLDRQLGRFIEGLPSYVDWFRNHAAPWLSLRFGLALDDVFDADSIVGIVRSHWQEAGGVARNLLAMLSRSGMAVLAVVANLLLIPVVTFYLLRDWDLMLARLRMLLPRRVEPTVVQLAIDADLTLSAFLRGQLMVMLALGTIYAVGLSLIGLNLGVLIGFVAGIVSFVPYLGNIIGLTVALATVLVQYGDWFHVALVLGVFGLGQVLEGMVLTPWLVGDRIGMHPVAVIFSVLVGAELFGFLGVLLALPVAAVVMVVLRWLHERYRQSGLYGVPTEQRAAGSNAEPSSASFELIDTADGMVEASPSARPSEGTSWGDAANGPRLPLAETPNATANSIDADRRRGPEPQPREG